MADLSVTSANVSTGTGASVVAGTAGGTVDAGDAIYKDSAGKIVKAEAGDTQAKAQAKGIAVNSAASGQPVDYIQSGDLNPGATLTVGEVYVLSTTAGGIAPVGDLVSTNYVTVLGVATASDNLKVAPIVSDTQKA